MKFRAWHIIVAVVVILGLWGVTTYNGLLAADGNVTAKWANVESDYQRRFDLVPNLVSTVKGAANFEQETLTQITEARTKWMAGGSADNRVAAANQFESALSRLLVTVEAYPQLNATGAFRDLMTQLEGTENRINVSRKDYNDAVFSYNYKVRRFPSNLLAGLFGFSAKESFESAEGAENAPKVEF
jgi:LemA protein